jgi:hypothetical protein
MKKSTILFVQGGAKGAYHADKMLALYLKDNLGQAYAVNYPKRYKRKITAFLLPNSSTEYLRPDIINNLLPFIKRHWFTGYKSHNVFERGDKYWLDFPFKNVASV